MLAISISSATIAPNRPTSSERQASNHSPTQEVSRQTNDEWRPFPKCSLGRRRQDSSWGQPARAEAQ